MKRKEVESSNIKSIGWENHILEVEFHSGSIYQYAPVGETIFQTFLEAESKGKYFQQYVKGQFPTEKMEADYKVKKLRHFEGQICKCGEIDCICLKDLRKEMERYISLFSYDDGKESMKCCRETVIAFLNYFLS
jgi:hypothetical protein